MYVVIGADMLFALFHPLRWVFRVINKYFLVYVWDLQFLKQKLLMWMMNDFLLFSISSGYIIQIPPSPALPLPSSYPIARNRIRHRVSTARLSVQRCGRSCDFRMQSAPGDEWERELYLFSSIFNNIIFVLSMLWKYYSTYPLACPYKIIICSVKSKRNH